MRTDIETQESELLDRLRKQYEGRGYTFVANPRARDIPAFLEGYIPDAIAMSKNDKVIIEVKSTNKRAHENSMVRFLAAEVPKHAGWRFDLVIAEKDSGSLDADAEPDKRQLAEERTRVQNALQSGDFKTALVLGWALLEAVTRQLVLNQRKGESKRYLPRTIVETLVSDGYASDEVGERLLKLAHLRNRLVHGFSRLDVEKSDIDFLLSVLNKLLGELK